MVFGCLFCGTDPEFDKQERDEAARSAPVVEIPSPLESSKPARPVARSPTESLVPPPSDPFGPWLHPLEAVVRLAAEEPDAIAILTIENGSTEKYTYRQLWERAYSIAQGLKALPDWSDDSPAVGLYCDHEVYWVFYVYAIWITGKRVFNFALNWHSDFRNQVAKKLNIKYVLYHFVTPGRIEGTTPLGSDKFPQLENIPVPSLSACAPLEDLVAYFSTAGTTGTPRAYAVSHKAGIPRRNSLGVPYGAVGIYQEPSFALMFTFLLFAPNVKGSLWFPKPSASPVERANGVLDLLNLGMDILQGTPSLLRLMFKLDRVHTEYKNWSGVRRIFMAAELVPAHLLEQAKMLCPNAVIECSYGSSEIAVIHGQSQCTINPSEPIPERLVYVIKRPSIRCLVVDENGKMLDPTESKKGILVLAVNQNDPVSKHPDFVAADPQDKLATFGFLEDGSPRICTMDEVELTGERSFVVLGRYGKNVKVNGLQVDLRLVEEILSIAISSMITDCALVQTHDEKIALLYVLRKDYPTALSPRQIQDSAETIFALKNLSNISIHTCLELSEIPFNHAGKRDLKKLKRIAERADFYELAISYPALDINDTALAVIAITISRLGSHILDVEALDGRNYYIAGVGFDSLTAGRLALAIKDEFNVEITPLVLLSNGMTPLSVASIVADIRDGRDFHPPTIDLAEQVELYDDASVTAEGLAPLAFPRSPRSILLTGATGFLGIFLVFELAAQFPDAKIICMVRASSETEALERLRQSASTVVVGSHNGTNPKYNVWDRVLPICGDLGLEKWGLSDRLWNELAEQTDVIVHNGAEVHWLHNYNRLKGPNVLGTVTALKLATAHHLKPIHYISEARVIPQSVYSSQPLEEILYSADDLTGGYVQTKWVSEQLIDRTRSRGVPATIIRPAGIVGDSIYGVSNSDDYIWRYVKECIQLGVAPCLGSTLSTSIDPVDHVARVITEIVAAQDSLDKFVFHISDPENSAISEAELFEAVKELGWDITFESRDRFRAILADSRTAQQNVLFPLMHAAMSASFLMDNKHTRAIYSVQSPPARTQVVNSLRYLQRARFLPRPATSPILDDVDAGLSIVGRTGRS
ncbi:male sterility protein-domain-containing protein [Polychytrium aggregatum]|uniref:male sterility protein-domain-containing protein n=1 Tax=Polychytrium aggregatum TaxID=110093 RepID=UPI0022FE9E66|nr:male sterility protein-domain-containing protein [Polychytrium aggregatum]KAI9202478.1 male sterility protein-domain-containing protein [Polychytrium aggregatum]